MYTIGVMTMPADFKYREVFLRGRPQHDRCDRFSIRHPKMNVRKRAKIFAPFDALAGFSEAVAAKDVKYVERIELSDEERAELNRRLDILRNLTYTGRMARANRVTVRVTYFVPCADKHHEAYAQRGQYRTVKGICWNVDPDGTQTIRVGNIRIAFADILRIESLVGVFSKWWEMQERNY